MKQKMFKSMAFYNQHGFVSAFTQAMKFAGKDGRVATLPDIIEARMMTVPGDCPWEKYFTTMSAEYVGLSKAGHPIAIVAHGVGPMSTLEGVLAAYGYEFNDKEHNRRGGRISQEDFLKLESGEFGDVHVIDLVAAWNRRDYSFSGHPVTRKEIEEEPLWQARLGKKWLEYCHCHESHADSWYDEEGKEKYLMPCILGMDTAANCAYSSQEIFDSRLQRAPGMAIAHLLSIGQLTRYNHQYYEHKYEQSENRTSLACDVSCHEWWNGTRLLSIQQGSDLKNIHPGLSSHSELVKTRLDKLFKLNANGLKQTTDGFWHLIQIDKRIFTDYPKKGERMDNGEPEFLVTKIEKISEGPIQFSTAIGGYHGFLKYGIDEVKRIAPPEANAYTLDATKIECIGGSPMYHVVPITFYKVEVDSSRRLVRMEDIYRDYHLMMSLI
jgi:hypothetical protein